MLHHGIYQALSLVSKSRASSTTGDDLSLLPLQQRDNYLLTLDVLDDNNFNTVLERFVILSSLQVAQVNTKKFPVLNQLVSVKKLGISHKNALNMIHHTAHHDVHVVLHPFLSWKFRSNDYQLRKRRLPHDI